MRPSSADTSLPGKASLVKPADARSHYYIRLLVTDKPGVMRDVAAIMTENKISIAQAIQRPLVESFMHRSNTNDEVLLDEFLVSDTSPLVGRSLAEAALTKSHDVIILAIKSQGNPILQKTRADTVVQAGDVLLVAGSKIHLQKLNEMM